MDFKELIELRDKAEAVSDKLIVIDIRESYGARLFINGLHVSEGLSPTELEAKLAELATPPKPATVMVEVPTDWAIWRGNGCKGVFTSEASRAVDAVCRNAVEQWLPVK